MKQGSWGMAVFATVVALWSAPASAQDVLVQRQTDPGTGAVIRVYRGLEGGSVDVQAADLRIRKHIADGKVVTTLSQGRDRLVIAYDQRTMHVSGSEGQVLASRLEAAELSRAKGMVARSALARRAAALIGRMGFGADTPVAPVLLTTRAMLLAAADDQSGGAELARWVRQLRSKTQVIKAGVAQKTPTECWDAYAKEAIAAAIEYEQCTAGLSWWDVGPLLACATIYDLRAIGAFSWWLNCVSLMGAISG
jgi:hypothetical protein